MTAEHKQVGIVLCGIKHSGKSAIGKELSRKLKMPFLDLDQLAEEEFFQASGRRLSVREIYQQLGQEEFLRWEATAVQKLLASPQPAVLALGGGTPVNPNIDSEYLNKLGKVVLIDLNPEIAWKRVLAGGMPPFLQKSADPKQDFLQMCQKRINFYQQLAAMTHHINKEVTVAEETEKILAELIDKWPELFR